MDNFTAEPMTVDDWRSLRVLKNGKEHNWGDISIIDRRVIIELDRFCADRDLTPLVTCGTTGAHVKGSYHYGNPKLLACALDVMFPKLPRKSLPDTFLALLRYRFNGVGIYSQWALSAGGKALGGFHVDMRPVDKKALWLCRQKGNYEGVTMSALREFFT